MQEGRFIYASGTLTFVTVAVKFCTILEKCGEQTRTAFENDMLKVAPLLYLQAQQLPEVESDGEALPQGQVTPEDYDWVCEGVSKLLGDDDVYLDTCQPEEHSTEETCWRSVSEHLADVYQPVRNFLAAYQGGMEAEMNDALWAVAQNFRDYWGQALLDALRQLHRLKYRTTGDGDMYD